MFDKKRDQLVLAVLQRPQPRFPQEVLVRIREALALLMAQVSDEERLERKDSEEANDEIAD